MQRYLLLGTAGHIDHGKTSLIKALTGTDTDRLPEEKQRGITIDLGFASLDLDDVHLGIVDVPGHERFVKNMLAGALGIDLALLVVAADEGIMPQTREHFEALSYLGITTGVIALTKCDLAEVSWMDLVEADLHELVTSSFLEQAPIVRVSSQTGEGLDQLRNQLAAAAEHVPERDAGGPFRLSIDRCFSAPGHGTVVTGSVASGQIDVGEKLQLLPPGSIVQVRGLQSHGQQQTSVLRGQRAAINLSGIHYREVHRGNLLATPDCLTSSNLLSIELQASRFRPQTLKSNIGVRFYTGTAETVGRLRLLESASLAAGEKQVAQIELEHPVSTVWGEAFVARGLAANEVFGGGRVIDPLARRATRNQLARVGWIRQLNSAEESQRVAAITALSGARVWTPSELWQRAGTTRAEAILPALVKTGELVSFECRTSRCWLHREVVELLECRLLGALKSQHAAEPLLARIPLGRLQKSFTQLEPPELLAQLASRLASAGEILMEGDYVAVSDWRPALSAAQQEQLQHMIAKCAASGLTPPSVAEFASELSLGVDETESLLQVAESSGQLVRMPDKEPRDAKAAQRARLYVQRNALDRLLQKLGSVLDSANPWTVSQFGEALGLSRKYAIPLCKYLDQTGNTVREGDLRRVVSAKTASE